jgi:hypothetical protein
MNGTFLPEFQLPGWPILDEKEVMVGIKSGRTRRATLVVGFRGVSFGIVRVVV